MIFILNRRILIGIRCIIMQIRNNVDKVIEIVLKRLIIQLLKKILTINRTKPLSFLINKNLYIIHLLIMFKVRVAKMIIQNGKIFLIKLVIPDNH